MTERIEVYPASANSKNSWEVVVGGKKHQFVGPLPNVLDLLRQRYPGSQIRKNILPRKRNRSVR